MNKDQLLRMLDAFLSQSGLYHHEALPGDLLSLLRKSGIEAEFLKEFVKMQSQYDVLGRAQAEQLRQYERIDDRLYSLHIDKGRKFNIRILIYRISFMITQIMELVIYIDILIFNLIKNVFILRKRFFIGFFY